MRIEQAIRYCFGLFIFFLPWQTRYSLRIGQLNGGVWEYGNISVYAFDVVFVVWFGLFCWWLWKWRTGNLEHRIQNHELRMKNQRILLAVVLFFFFALLSVLFTTYDRVLAWYQFARLLQALAIFSFAMVFPLTPRDITVPLIAAGALQGLIAYGQFIAQYIPASTWLGWATHDPSQLGSAVIETASGRFLRAYGSFPHPNMLGGFLALCVLMTLSTTRTELNRCYSFLFTIAGIFITIGLVFSFSRGAALAAFLGVIVFFLSSENRRNKNLLSLLGICVVTVVIFTGMNFSLSRARVESSGRLEQKSLEERFSGLRYALRIIRNHPWFGVGMGSYTKTLSELFPGHPVWYYQPAHNGFLLIFAETGVFGFLSWIALFTMGLTRSFCQLSGKSSAHFLSLMIAITILLLFDHYFLTSVSMLLMFWMVMGLREHKI